MKYIIKQKLGVFKYLEMNETTKNSLIISTTSKAELKPTCPPLT